MAILEAKTSNELSDISDEELIAKLEAEPDFIGDFTDYARESTDAPKIYHRFMAYGTVSAVVGRNVYLPFGSQMVYPNLWIILIGKSSVLHKSTCLNYARDLIREVRSDIVLPNEFTPEKLVNLLGASPQGVFIWDEMASFLGQVGKDYMAGGKEILTHLYDCPPIYTRKTQGGSSEVKNPYITILSATTPDWLTKQLSQTDVRGGFFVRFICVPAYKKEKFFSVPPEADKDMRQGLIYQLKAIEGVAGKMELEKEAHEAYDKWSRTNEDETIRLDGSLLDGFYSRLSIYALKFAMLNELTISRELTISFDSMERAISLVEWLKGSLYTLVEDELAFGRYEQNEKQILRHLKKETEMSRVDILRKTRLQVDKEFNPAMNTLIAKGLVEPVPQERERVQGGGRPRIVYRYLGK